MPIRVILKMCQRVVECFGLSIEKEWNQRNSDLIYELNQNKIPDSTLIGLDFAVSRLIISHLEPDLTYIVIENFPKKKVKSFYFLICMTAVN